MTSNQHSELIEEIRQGISHAYTLELFERLVEQLEALQADACITCQERDAENESLREQLEALAEGIKGLREAFLEATGWSSYEQLDEYLVRRHKRISNPASGEQTLREPSRSGGLRPESLPPETSSPASSQKVPPGGEQGAHPAPSTTRRVWRNTGEADL